MLFDQIMGSIAVPQVGVFSLEHGLPQVYGEIFPNSVYDRYLGLLCSEFKDRVLG